WLARHPSALRAALTGVVCAVMAFSAHPETIFFAVVFAALLAYFSIVFSAIMDAAPQHFASKKPVFDFFLRAGIAKLKALGYLALTAAVSLVVALPLVLPFLEFMRNSHLYKESY